MLSDGSQLICPAKQHSVHQVIVFRNLADLYSQLSGILVEQESVPTPSLNPTTSPSPPTVPGTSVIATQPAMYKTIVEAEVDSSPQDVATEMAPETTLEDIKPGTEPEIISKDDAAYRIQSFWRKCLTRRRLRDESEFDEEGARYEQFRPLFLVFIKQTKSRERLLLWLLRGPCLSVFLALQTLIQELEEFLENLNNRLKAPGLNPKNIAQVQKEIERDRRLAR